MLRALEIDDLLWVIFLQDLVSSQKHCLELLETIKTMEKGLNAPLENISQEHLNYVFADHKMTIGQIAIHCTAWAEYFMAGENKKPWELEKWTCRPCEYPLTLDFVYSVVKSGFDAIRKKLESINDDILEIENGKKGPGYIICRLQLHALAHSNQMAYLRQLLEPSWEFGSHFGDMATAYIQLGYSTDRDISVRGF